MNPSLWLAFFVTATVAALVPGPAVLYVVGQGMRHGARKALAANLGILSGNLIWFTASAIGLAALVAYAAPVFVAIKWIGVAYLVWFGARTILRPPKLETVQPDKGRGSAGRLFAGGFMLQIVNPSVLLFFTAFLPQFLDPRAALVPQLAILAAATAAIEIVTQLVYAFLAGRFRALLTAPRFARWTDRIAGSLLIAAGLGMAALRRG